MQLTACSIGGKQPVLTCDDYEVKLGKATVAELKEGDESYGDMLAGNKKSSRIEFDKGVIFEIVLTYDDPDYSMGEVLVNGVNFEGYTREKIKEAMGMQKLHWTVTHIWFLSQVVVNILLISMRVPRQ